MVNSQMQVLDSSSRVETEIMVLNMVMHQRTQNSAQESTMIFQIFFTKKIVTMKKLDLF
jgi:hypothetical protein